MRWTVVDQNGKFWPQPAQLLSQTFGIQPQSSRRHDFLIRNLGCVAVGFGGDSCVIRAAPGRTQYQVFAQVGKIVEECAPSRVALSWYDEAWRYEIFANTRDALEQLLALMTAAAQPSLYYQRCRPLDSLHRAHFLQPLIEFWRAEAGEVDMARHTQEIAHHTADKYLTVYADPSNGQLKFSQFGSAWIVYQDRRWLKKCIGQRVEDQPDIEYGKWIAATYREAFLSSEPTLMEADVVVTDPTGGGDRRIQYHRLTTPVHGADGTRQMLCTSCPDTSVDLRPPVH